VVHCSMIASMPLKDMLTSYHIAPTQSPQN
jgi:hypothetical protein